MESPFNLKDLAAVESFPGLSLRFLKENRILPLKREDGHILLATADPGNQELRSAIEVALGAPVVTVEAREEEILELIQTVYEPGSPMSRLVNDLGAEEMDLESEETSEIGHLRDMAREAPTIQLVNLLLLRAVQMGASDIHLEPFEDIFRVRYRKDGILYEAESPPKALQAVVLSRLKIMARLDIAERRLPQDGRFRLKVKGHDVDFRVSTIPTLLGESMVIRILDREKVIFDLRGLGFPDGELQQFIDLIHKPYGMLLVTGPTGSGKTTTLYAALERINSPEKKIITIEDPVEYRLAGVTQMQVKPAINLTFARGLRHIVRQDPDVVLVGEIRDRETAEIAVHAALTGHLVFSTLHTNDAPGAVTRLMEMGIEDFLLSSAVLGILAQRLVRLICPECRVPLPQETAEQELRRAHNGTLSQGEGNQLYIGAGCSACTHTGYQGRTGIYELLLIDDEVRQLILQRADAATLRQAAIRNGMLTLAADGWSKVATGLTTIQEVLRVTQE
jgi:general secretion pathway protein E